MLGRMTDVGMRAGFVRHSCNRNEFRISTQHDREEFLIDRIALVIMVIATIGTFDREVFRQFAGFATCTPSPS